MKILKVLVGLGMMLTAAAYAADPKDLQLTFETANAPFATYRIANEDQFHYAGNGFGLRYPFTEDKRCYGSVGRFKNEYDHNSQYALADCDLYRKGNENAKGVVGAGVFMGYMSGFTDGQNRFRPVVAGVEGGYRYKHFGVVARAMPPTGPDSSGLLTFQFYYQF